MAVRGRVDWQKEAMECVDPHPRTELSSALQRGLISPVRRPNASSFFYLEEILDDCEFGLVLDSYKQNGFFKDTEEGTAAYTELLTGIAEEYVRVNDERMAEKFKCRGVDHAKRNEFR
ncbi:unnamed protein product, partial [Discosporangium mesarthrocarpum]